MGGIHDGIGEVEKFLFCGLVPQWLASPAIML